VLELGCGDCRDLAAYSATFGVAVSAIFLDCDLAALHCARFSFPDATLLQGDIRRLPLRAPFDLVVARHPDVDRSPEDWRTALQAASARLATGGILLMTTYSAPELERISGWLASCNLRPCAVSSARLSPPGLSGRDRFVAAYRSYNN
jgi:SAM-dependent methyltransferase